MSASAVLSSHGHYKEQLKLMRAETTAAWLEIVIDRLGEAFKSEPVAIETPQPQRYFGAFY